jgi:acetylornithine deacetylase/succinyl-diaminopimelate desuccinylase-like protein
MQISETRLLKTAVQLIEIPSPTQSAKDVADKLAEILQSDGFAVERPDCGWPAAPAVVGRFDSGRPGPTIQFNGHLDTVHLPFVPPRVENGLLYGSGSSDMKGGVAAMVEAARAVRDADALQCGSILITAHDLHESPWGDGSQVDGLIENGFLGDAVLIPEYLSTVLPLAGRGLTILELTFRRDGEPVHEVLGGSEQASVIGAASAMTAAMIARGIELQKHEHPMAGKANCFVGQIHGGEIYNQSPVECKLSGTRRWLPGDSVDEVEQEIREMVSHIEQAHGVTCDLGYHFVRDAFELTGDEVIVTAFQTAYQAVCGEQLPTGAKPFVDDVNTFVHRGKIPGITHGPNAKGAHTVNEEVPVAELVRVAEVYARTAVEFCVGAD